MDIFKVHGQLIEDYKSFTTSSVTPLDPRVAQYVADELAEGKQWPEPWLSLNPTFASGGTIDDLVAEGVLHPECSNSFVFDFVARQKVGGTHLKFFTMRQLPMLSREASDSRPVWSMESVAGWVNDRVLALTVDNLEMKPLAAEFGFRPTESPWDVEGRRLLRAELDAAFFHLYGIERDDVDYIMETFPIVKRKDIAAHGEYRTKRMILEIYDAMAHAQATGIPYASPFDTVEKEA